MKTLFIISSVIALISAVALFSGCSRHGHKDPQKHMDYMVKKASKKLDLNSNQVVNLEAFGQTLLNSFADHKAKKQEAMETVKQAFASERLDQASLVTLIQSHTREIENKAPQVIASFAQFYDSLDGEQQAKLREHLQEKMARHHRHHE
ncbi:MAG: Spy/CpxP family protein refolding chaperone [Gammaproteobacteria bacterium]|nr:Spy/CpxP family protein refolding chaperone [Gammaproteobacteria bacterium]